MTPDGGPSAADERLRAIVADDRARLVGALTRWCGDLQLAEDGFGEAVEAALRTWPTRPPADGRAWLVTVARNRIRDVRRSAAARTSTPLSDAVVDTLEDDLTTSRDDTLALLFACAHPALDRGVHAPLILQVALGVSTADIATAFALPVATLSKRLVRAKQKLRLNRAAFEIPERIDPGRIDAVLDAIYAAYAVDWLRISPPGAAERVAEEAIHASQLLLRACPEHHEVRGLAALLLFLHSRSAARIRHDVLVPLEEQDPGDWDGHLIARGHRILRAGAELPRAAPPGPYELQAAIQAAHATRPQGGRPPWPVIVGLYDALVAQTPSMGARVARAVAVGRATDAAAGLAILASLQVSHPAVEAFQPYHAARGALLREAGRTDEARAALQRALDLCTEIPSRAHLARLIATL
ncbi:MAG: sigma factor [Arachnia sp.]